MRYNGSSSRWTKARPGFIVQEDFRTSLLDMAQSTGPGYIGKSFSRIRQNKSCRLIFLAKVI